jgi:hypothetical protein
MKQLLLYIVAFFSITVATAQVWCPPGATWHFKRGGPYYSTDGVMELAYAGDVTQLGVSCKKLDAAFTGITMYSSPNVITQNFNTYYTHLTNGVLYILNGSRFDTIVNFNALPGDKWLRPGFDSVGSGGCNSRRPYTVIDTGHVMVNGSNLKKVTASYLGFYNNGPTNTYTFAVQQTFVERILFYGWASYNLFPIDCERDNIIGGPPVTSFRCYEDDSFPLYNISNYGCGSLTGIKSLQENADNIVIYPNPAEDRLTLELPNASHYSLQLTDMLGNNRPLAAEMGDSKLRADLGAIPPGIYFIQVLENGRLVGIEKLVKN